MQKVAVGSLLSLGLFILGCGSSAGQHQTHKVTGKVLMNGAPVIGASVAFSPTGKGMPAALGQTDTQGVYTLTTYAAGDGAPEGEYKILVTKSAPAADPESNKPTHDPTGKNKSVAPTHSGGGKGKTTPTGHLLPDKFAKVATTPLVKTVVAGPNTIDLDLDK